MQVSIICLLLFSLIGCVGLSEQAWFVEREEISLAAPKNDLIQFSHHLVKKLALAREDISAEASIAVGTFSPIDTLKFDSDNDESLKFLALQLSEGLSSAMTQQGFRIIEYKLRDSISIKPDQDLMLSRKLTDLRDKHYIDYFLTGTLTESKQGILVNARLIDARSKLVIAAVTDRLDKSAWRSDTSTVIKNGFIYRNAK